MPGITHIAVGETSEEVPRRRFRATSRTKLSPEVLARQSQVALLAFRYFADREAALQFLNGFDEALGGRPIDIASIDAACAERVAAVLR